MSVAAWYEKVLNKKPYFENENYMGFDVAWYELGIFKREGSSIKKWNNVEIYWWVDDIEWELKRLIDLWATLESPVVEVWGDITMASVIDPFWNIFGLIYNPHFKK